MSSGLELAEFHFAAKIGHEMFAKLKIPSDASISLIFLQESVKNYGK